MKIGMEYYIKSAKFIEISHNILVLIFKTISLH